MKQMIRLGHGPYLGIVAAMRTQRLKYYDVAPHLGITSSTFGRKINGIDGADFTIQEGIKLAEVLGKPQSFLFYQIPEDMGEEDIP